jgi:O-antigen/teichoic acid export membrane protein
MTPLRAAIAWTLAGNTIYAACQWSMLVVVAKLASAESVGSFALAFAVTAPLMMLSNLQLRAVQATDARNQFAFGHYLALRLITIGVALPACLWVAYFGRNGPVLMVALLIAIAKAGESMSDILYGLMQRHREMRSIAVSMIVKGVLSLLALALVLYITASLPLACLALACSWVLILGLYDLPAARTLLAARQLPMKPIWNWQALRALVTVAFPLGLVMGVLSLHANAPRYFIGASLTVSDVGAFSAMASLGVVGATICNALGQVASPRLAKDYADRKHRLFLLSLAKLLTVALALGITGVVAALTVGPWLLTALFRPEYGRLQGVFVILMISAGLSYLASALGYALTAARQFRPQLPIFVTALFVTTAMCAWLVPQMGLRGAALGAAAGSLTQTCGAAWVFFSTVGVKTEMRPMQLAA